LRRYQLPFAVLHFSFVIAGGRHSGNDKRKTKNGEWKMKRD
jgi:hypothetical protein